MRFSTPLALLLLLLLPAAAYLGWPRPGPNRARERLTLALRLLILALLIFSLAGLELVRLAQELAVVYLIDVSDSVPEASRETALDYVRRSLTGMRPGDQAAVVVFGGDALVERPMSSSPVLGPLASVPQTGATDLGEAIRLGLALYPPEAGKRMLLLSDGQDNTGQAAAAARLAAAGGVELWAVPLPGGEGPEVLLADVDLPPNLRQGETFQLQITAAASAPARAGVRVFAGGGLVYQGEIELGPGEERFSLPLTAGEPGFYTYEVQLDPERDGFYQNNRLAAFTQVEGPPLVLVVAPPEGEALFSGEPRPDEAAQLRQVLEAAQIQVQAAVPAELPPDAAGLLPYSAVVLVDVPARSLSPRQMEALQAYVRDLGGGLLAVGGPTSYGVGGYFRTPLEETLPVEMQIKDPLRRPEVTLLFIIDRSGSMSESSGGLTKLDLAKEAAQRSLDLLFPNDRVGVVAFDDSAMWAAPIQDLTQPDTLRAAIGSLRPGGGTDILAGLQAAARELPQAPGQVKHIILLTDGGASPAGIRELAQELHEEHGITLSTVGVGQDAAAFLPDIAAVGGGRYHFAADPSSIPSIFTEETTLASRSYLVEESFYPLLGSSSPILSGITALPPLHGYVATSPKPAARNVLLSPQGDPILASWQYGLGRAVAFTSDATGRWARDWLGWTGYAAFWPQAVRYTLRQPSTGVLDARVELEGDRARLVVNAQTASGVYLNHYDLQARLLSPQGEALELALEQTASGRYEGVFTPGSPGVYLIGLSGQAPEESVGSGPQAAAETTGWVFAYSPEYRELEGDPQALARLANIAGGGLAPDAPEAVFRRDFEAGRARRTVWPWLLALSALLLPFDIAVRRLALTPREIAGSLRRGAAALRARLSPAPLPEGPVVERPESLEALAQARRRARPGPGASAPPGEAPPAPPEPRPAPEKPAASERRPAPEPPPRPPAPERPAQEGREAAEEDAASTAARLLAQKRKKRS